MKAILIILGLAAVTLAAPPAHGGAHDPHAGAGNHGPEPTPAEVGEKIYPYYPFPHVEDFAMFRYEDMFLISGSFFTVVDEKGACQKVALGEEGGGKCPMNQTICDQIAAKVCEPAVANATCVDSNHKGTYNETNNEGFAVPEGHNGFLHGGPLCHIEVMNRKMQPTSGGAIYVISPKVKTCYFTLAPAPTAAAGHAEPAHGHHEPPCPYAAES